MNLVKGTAYKVKDNHPHHAGKIGRFEFLGGPQKDVIVLSEPDKPNTLFAVGYNDLTDFHPESGDTVVVGPVNEMNLSMDGAWHVQFITGLNVGPMGNQALIFDQTPTHDEIGQAIKLWAESYARMPGEGEYLIDLWKQHLHRVSSVPYFHR